mgnify:FL=1
MSFLLSRLSLRLGTLCLLALVPGILSAKTTIHWWHAMGGVTGESLEDIAEGFNQSQDDYEIQPVFKGNYTETMTSAIAAFRAGKQPGLLQVFEVGTATMMYAKGAIRPVEKLMKDEGQPFDRSAFIPAVVSYYESDNGQLLSLPFNSSTPVLWYNQDALDKAGVEKVPTTWKEMGEAAQKLVDSGMECGFAVGYQSWVLIENFSAWHNLPLGTLDNGYGGLGTQLTFNNDAVEGILSRLQEWTKDSRFVYGGRQGKSLPLFTNGKCGMWMNSSAYYGSIEDQAQFKFGQAMMPLDTEVASAPQNSIIGGATLWVLEGRPKEEYAGIARFLTYLSQPDVQKTWAERTGYVPITTAASALMKKQGFYQKNPGTDTAVQELSLNPPTANTRGLRFGNFVQIREVINTELEAVWSGKKTPAEAMDAAVKKGNKLLRRFEKAHDN